METSFISTAIVLLFITFIMYRIGLIRLAQTTSDRLITQADQGLEIWSITNDEKRSKQYGKLETKLKDTSTNRSSASAVRAQLAKLEAKVKAS